MQFLNKKIKTQPLSERKSKTDLSVMVNPNSSPPQISQQECSRLEDMALSIKKSKEDNSPIIFAFGAHLIKNGLSKIIIELMEKNYVSHILGNGAISIHDWEFAFQGKTEEDVKKYLAEGQFGIWEETGKYINRAIIENQELGYGTAIGKLISEEKLNEKHISHPYKEISILGNAFSLNIPVSICPGIGYDIIYTHPECKGEAIGKASYIDFLKLTDTLSGLEGGIYISIGSAITSPMVFEKALSMARNIANQKNRKIENFNIIVNDIQKGEWDWTKGEPSKDNPAYYLRFMKTFSRASPNLEYICMDNKAFLHNLCHMLIK